ncbi:MAG: hypothetical protein NZ804_09830 [Roseibacillus sp.]|nr:hypothetical protein [Roseibacillus sp.]
MVQLELIGEGGRQLCGTHPEKTWRLGTTRRRGGNFNLQSRFPLKLPLTLHFHLDLNLTITLHFHLDLNLTLTLHFHLDLKRNGIRKRGLSFRPFLLGGKQAHAQREASQQKKGRRSHGLCAGDYTGSLQPPGSGDTLQQFRNKPDSPSSVDPSLVKPPIPACGERLFLPRPVQFFTP